MKITQLLNDDQSSTLSSKQLKPLRKRIGLNQLQELQALFDSGIRFPDKSFREKLGEKLGLSGRTIQIWFQNRRQNMKGIEKEDLQTAFILQSLKLAIK